MCVVLVPIIGLAPAYQTLHKYAHSTLEMSCVSTGNVRGASSKYWYQHQYIQHYTNTPTALQKRHMCPLGMCVVLVPNIGISTSISNTTQIRPQTFERSCVSTGNVRYASAKYWYQHQHIQHYTNTPTVVKKLHVCPLGMCVVLVPNIGISTSISNITQIRLQQLRNFMCVHWECAWFQCQILVLAPVYPTLHKYAHSTSERSCVSPGNVRGASAKYWYQNQHIKHYTNTPTVVKKLHVCPLGMCVVLVPNIGISTSISNTTQIRPQTFERSRVSTGNVRCASAKYWYQHQHIQHYTNTPTVVKKLHVCPLGMCVVLVPNFGISTSISNITQIRLQQLRNFMCVHWECAWFQCQIWVLAPAYPTLHKYARSTSKRSCVSTGNVRGASSKYWYQHQYIQHYTNTPTALQKLHMCPLGMCVVLVPNIGISTSISNTTQIRPQTFERSRVSTGNVRCASAKYWYQHQHIQHYTNTPTVVKKLHVCPLGMCVVLVPNIGISTSISNITQIRLQQLRNFMCVHWECAWFQCQILVLAPVYPTLHKNAHSTSERSCVSPGNVRGASAKYWYQHQHIQHYTNTPTVVKKLHVCPLGMCVVLVPNIGINTSISNTTQIRPQHFRKVMCVPWECAWCQCQILVLAPAYPTLHKYAYSS